MTCGRAGWRGTKLTLPRTFGVPGVAGVAGILDAELSESRLKGFVTREALKVAESLDHVKGWQLLRVPVAFVAC